MKTIDVTFAHGQPARQHDEKRSGKTPDRKTESQQTTGQQTSRSNTKPLTGKKMNVQRRSGSAQRWEDFRTFISSREPSYRWVRTDNSVKSIVFGVEKCRALS
jgi:hypothetical protein